MRGVASALPARADTESRGFRPVCMRPDRLDKQGVTISTRKATKVGRAAPNSSSDPSCKAGSVRIYVLWRNLAGRLTRNKRGRWEGYWSRCALECVTVFTESRRSREADLDVVFGRLRKGQQPRTFARQQLERSSQSRSLKSASVVGGAAMCQPHDSVLDSAESRGSNLTLPNGASPERNALTLTVA